MDVGRRESQNAKPFDSSPQRLTKEELVAALAHETGIESDLAREYLSSNNWNLSKAIEGFKLLVAHEKQISNKDKSTVSSSSNLSAKKPFGRGLSLSNMKIVQEARDTLAVVDSKPEHSLTLDMFDPVSSQTNFVLPDISKLSTDLATFIRDDLVDVSTLQNLVAADRLNWWSELGTCRKLFPLSTVGDGNCLLHAASLGMWGFHDRLLNLRKALHQLLLNPLANKSLRRRWKYSIWQGNLKCGGLTYSQDEWKEEWASVVKLTSDRPHFLENGMSSRRTSRQMSFVSNDNGSAIPHLREGECLDSLEPIHVYALANLLCRPIIVISEEMLVDTLGHPIAPIPFGGIYLPLEREPRICSKYPLVLSYDLSHFCALVCAEGEESCKSGKLSTSVPLEDKMFRLLTLRFLIDPGSTWDLVQDDGVKEEVEEMSDFDKVKLLRQYLDVVKVPIKQTQPGKSPNYNREFSIGKSVEHVTNLVVKETREMLLAAKLNIQKRPVRYNEMMNNYLVSAKERFIESRVKCLTCNFSAQTGLDGYCSECHDIRLRKEQKQKNKLQKQQLKQTEPRVESLVNKTSAANNTMANKSTLENRAKTSKQTHHGTNIIHTTFPSENASDCVVPIVNVKTNLQRDGVSQNVVFERQADGIKSMQNHLPPPPSVVVTEPRSVSNQLSSLVFTDPTFYESTVGIQCKSTACRFYGNESSLGYCSSCFKQYKIGRR